MKKNGKVKASFETVKKSFENKRLILLETNYIDRNTPMKCLCHCGQTFYPKFGHIKMIDGCRECANRKLRHPQKYIEKYFKEHGCKLLSIYINNITNLEYICNCGEKAITTFNRFQIGRRCKKCGDKKAGIKRSKEKHYKWIDDRDKAKKNRKIQAVFNQLLNKHLRRSKQRKTNRTAILLGYSKEDLWNRLYSHPNMQRIIDMGEKFSIDHIFPVDAFTEHNILDPKVVNALDNLQPMDLKENISKNSKYNKEEFYSYLLNKYGKEQCKNWGIPIKENNERI